MKEFISEMYFFYLAYRIVPNCVTKAKNVRTRIFIGDQIDDCKDLSGLYYLLPFQKVYNFPIIYDNQLEVFEVYSIFTMSRFCDYGT